MEKGALVWLIIRLIGLLVLGLAIFQVLAFIMNIISILSFDSSSGIGEGIIRFPNLRWDPLFNGILLSSVAFYFLRRGETVYLWLLKEGGDDEA